MSIALSTKKVHCPNCNFEGKSKVKGTGGPMFVVALLVFVVSFLFWPLFIVAFVCLMISFFMPAKHVCPKCLWEAVVPTKDWEAQNKSDGPFKD